MTKIKAWITAARLRTLPLSVSGILVGAGAAMQVHSFSYLVFWLALATTIGFQILSNYANDYGDGVKGTDNASRIGPKRALQSGLLSAKELKRGMVVTTIITLFFASLLIFVAFGNENILFSVIFFNLGIAAIIAAIAYTVGKKAYGYRAMGDVFVFIFFGLVSVLGSYFLFTQKLQWSMLLPATTIGFLSAAVLNLNNMRDRIADAQVNKNTLAVKLGEKRVKIYHAFLLLIALVSAIVYFLLLGQKRWEWLPFIAFLPIIHNLKVVFQNESPVLLDPELKKVALSTFLFALLFFASNFF